MNNIRDIPSNQFVILYIPVCYHTVPQVKYRAVTGKLSTDGFRDIDIIPLRLDMVSQLDGMSFHQNGRISHHECSY